MQETEEILNSKEQHFQVGLVSSLIQMEQFDYLD
jgi:hypothetical protein